MALIAESLRSPFRPRIRAHAADILSGQPENLLEVNAEDVALVYTLRRYSRATTRVTTGLKAQGATLLLITDQGASPLGKIADQSLRVPTQGLEVVASLAPFISVTALLATLVTRELGGGHLQQAETLQADFSVYEY